MFTVHILTLEQNDYEYCWSKYILNLLSCCEGVEKKEWSKTLRLLIVSKFENEWFKTRWEDYKINGYKKGSRKVKWLQSISCITLTLNKQCHAWMDFFAVSSQHLIFSSKSLDATLFNQMLLQCREFGWLTSLVVRIC